MQYVIVGGGIAGTSAAGELRRLSPNSQITILEQENSTLYSKVLLSRYISSQIEREDLFLKRDSWYEKEKIELICAVRVQEIDRKNKFVKTNDGREFPFDKLLITTGLEVTLLPEDIQGVTYLRTLSDADNMRSLISKIRAEKKDELRMIIAGGSFIALEYLHICEALKIPATVLLRRKGFFGKILSQKGQNIVNQEASRIGIEYVPEAKWELLPGNEFTGVRLDDGSEKRADIFAVGIGLQVDKSPFENSGIIFSDNGISCDEYLRTNDENIFASGDIAFFNDTVVGRRVRAANWTNAIMQGRLSAINMVGKELKPFNFISSYTTWLGNLNMTFVGDFDAKASDEVINVSDSDAYYEIFNRNNKTVGAVILGKPTKRAQITNYIFEGKKYS